MADASEKRSNRALWLGLLFTVLGPAGNGLYFLGFPAVAVVWITLLLPALGLILLLIGLQRAFGRASLYGGKVWGSIAAALSIVVLGASVGMFVLSRRLPQPSTGTPQVSQRAPDFTLPASDGRPVSLSQLLAGSNAGSPPRAVLLIFYRGYW
ncbi:MAG TPA: hypothetical protein VIW68_01600 [Candidatus Sulfotelmatobacter sp.]